MSGDLTLIDDVCALPLVRRMAAMFDHDPSRYREGDPLPRGWHVCMFTVPTRQSELRTDGTADLGFALPDLGLPRLMIGGRRIHFVDDIPIGAPVRRETRRTSVTEKQGRSGRFAVVSVAHEVFVGNATRPVLVEEHDYLMREAATAHAASVAARASENRTAAAVVSRTLMPTEALLFRYSAVTFNPHRIHYDHPYATGPEGYPALVVNGGIPSLLLLELFKESAGREPVAVTVRNVGPLFCGRQMALNGIREGGGWRMWAEDDVGALALDASMT